jgi:hypothetical protein
MIVINLLIIFFKVKFFVKICFEFYIYIKEFHFWRKTMTLEEVKGEATVGGTVKAIHITTIVESLTAISVADALTDAAYTLTSVFVSASGSLQTQVTAINSLTSGFTLTSSMAAYSTTASLAAYSTTASLAAYSLSGHNHSLSSLTVGLLTFVDNADAATGGLSAAGSLYKTSAGVVMVTV